MSAGSADYGIHAPRNSPASNGIEVLDDEFSQEREIATDTDAALNIHGDIQGLCRPNDTFGASTHVQLGFGKIAPGRAIVGKFCSNRQAWHAASAGTMQRPRE